MKCRVCGKETDKIYDGMCTECMQQSVITEDKINDTAIKYAELEANSVISSGAAIEDNGIYNALCGMKEAEYGAKSDIRNDAVARQILMATLMATSGLYNASEKELSSINRLVEDNFDKFNRNCILKVVRISECSDDNKILASNGNIGIVEIHEA